MSKYKHSVCKVTDCTRYAHYEGLCARHLTVRWQEIKRRRREAHLLSAWGEVLCVVVQV